MSRMIAFLGVAVLLFSLAAGASWYLQNSQKKAGEEPKAGDEKVAKNAYDGPAVKAAKLEHGTPTAPLVRPPISSEAERNATAGLRFNEQEILMKSREKEVAEKEKRINIVHEKIREEHVFVESKRKEVKEELVKVEKQLEFLEKRAADVEKESQRVAVMMDEVQKMKLELKPTEMKNLKVLAAVYDKMDADKAAKTIVSMIKRGNLDDAVSIFSLMNTTKASSVFGAVDELDETSAQLLMERYKHVKAPPPAGQK